MSPPTPKVLIVGGGPSGLVLAISLLQNGIPVRIIEKNANPRVGQRGAGIMPRSLELFTTIRIIDKVLKRAIHVPRVHKYSIPESPKPTHEFDMHPPQQPTPSNPYLNPIMLGQDRLEKIFHNTLAELGCFVELGTELLSFVQFDDHVEAKLRTRPSDPPSDPAEEVASFEYMIGTDGAKGVVRKQLGLTFLGETMQIENFVVGDIRARGLSPKYWHIWGDATSVMVSLRGTEEPTLFNFVIAGKNINHAELAQNPDALKKVLAKHTGHREDIEFGDTTWVSYYTPNIRMVNKFGQGRVFVAGDSAHVHSPTGGQGVNTGIQDSFNLGWKLALVMKRYSSPTLLDTYTEERLPVVAEMLSRTTKILKTTFREGREKPWDKNTSLLQLGVNYRWSSIVFDERQLIEAPQETEDNDFLSQYTPEGEGDEEDIDSYGSCFDGPIRAGDRAPDASGLVDRSASSLFRTTYDLFRVYGSHYHTVMIFSELADPKPILKLLSIYPPGTVRSVVIIKRGRPVPESANSADLILEDYDNHAHNAYIPGNSCGIVTVRPDGVIGAIVADKRWLHKYFLAIFAGETRLSKSISASTSSLNSRASTPASNRCR